MSPVGYRYLMHVAPAVDRILIPRTRGRWSSGGLNRCGLVTTTGARSGQPRTLPLACIKDTDATLLLIASNYGRPNHPSWSANLRAHPRCTVTFAGTTADYLARELEGDEREDAWQRAVDWYAGYDRYRVRCSPRVVRVFRLTPA